jgi:hypothetical protein
MYCRTTVLAGTFTLICAVYPATAQTAAAPKTGVIYPRTLQAASRPVVTRPRIAVIAPPAGSVVAMPSMASMTSGQGLPRAPGSFINGGTTVFSPAVGTMVGVQGASAPVRRVGTARIAGIAPPPQTVPIQNLATNTGFVANGPPQVAAFYYLPAVVLTDGRVFASFNGNFEEVLRRCPQISGTLPPGFSVATCWTVDANGRYLVVQRR